MVTQSLGVIWDFQTGFSHQTPFQPSFPNQKKNLWVLPKYLKYLQEAQGAFVSQFRGKAGEECTWNSMNALQEQLPEPLSSRTRTKTNISTPRV